MHLYAEHLGIEGDCGVEVLLVDSTRIEIMRLLTAQDGPTCVCDIVDHFDLAQPTISHHLRVLREAGLLVATKVGIWSFYAPDPARQQLLPRVAELFNEAAGPPEAARSAAVAGSAAPPRDNPLVSDARRRRAARRKPHGHECPAHSESLRLDQPDPDTASQSRR